MAIMRRSHRIAGNPPRGIVVTIAVLAVLLLGGSRVEPSELSGVLAPRAVISCDDADADGIDDCTDNCPLVVNADQTDDDLDGIGYVCDACPEDSEDYTGFQDFDGCPEDDRDGDGWNDEIEFRSVSDPLDSLSTPESPLAVGSCVDGEDNDGDTFVDQLDPGCIATIPDGDLDGVPDEEDLCPSDFGPSEASGCPYLAVASPLALAFTDCLTGNPIGAEATGVLYGVPGAPTASLLKVLADGYLLEDVVHTVPCLSPVVPITTLTVPRRVPRLPRKLTQPPLCPSSVLPAAERIALQDEADVQQKRIARAIQEVKLIGTFVEKWAEATEKEAKETVDVDKKKQLEEAAARLKEGAQRYAALVESLEGLRKDGKIVNKDLGDLRGKAEGDTIFVDDDAVCPKYANEEVAKLSAFSDLNKLAAVLVHEQTHIDRDKARNGFQNFILSRASLATILSENPIEWVPYLAQYTYLVDKYILIAGLHKKEKNADKQRVLQLRLGDVGTNITDTLALLEANGGKTGKAIAGELRTLFDEIQSTFGPP